ncbi:MAG: hypothetical protein Q9170_002488 [Blastenia crenularia]
MTPNTSLRIPSISNFTFSTLPDTPDLHFRYVAAYHLPDLDSTACIMTSIFAMRELASLPINSLIDTDSTWTNPDYVGVSLSVRGEKSPRISVRWAMWLIHAGIKDMMVRNRYQKAIFFGWYNDIKVGSSYFTATTTEQGLQASSPLASNAKASIRANNNRTGTSFTFSIGSAGTTSKVGTANDDELHADIEYLPQPMDKRDSLITLIYLIMSLGGRNNEPLNVFHCTISAITAELGQSGMRFPLRRLEIIC